MEQDAVMMDEAADSRTTALRARAARTTPGGVHSNVRLTGPQRVLESGAGARLRDVDGHDYVDYVLGQGPNFLGHNPEPIRRAVLAQTESGLLLGGQTRVEIEAAEAFLDAVGWAEMVRFGVSGSEAVHGAIRLARAVTGRDTIIRFEGHYHGWLDSMLIAPGEHGWGPASAGQLGGDLSAQLLLPWNDVEAVDLAIAEHGRSIAAIITEPMMINSGAIEPDPGYLAHLRRACDGNGSLLIFDEVITGFRLAPGGAAEKYGVIPDLATYGKAMAAGWPVAAIAGRSEHLREFGTGRVNHSGTFNGSVLGAAAVSATMRYLREHSPYEQVDGYGTKLMRAIPALAAQAGHQVRVQGVPAAFHVSFGSADLTVRNVADLAQLDAARYQELLPLLVAAGLWLNARGLWYVSAAHGEPELADTLQRFADGIARLK
jgi:glutamate-1-semialdehyde 2,1-aminomutase